MFKESVIEIFKKHSILQKMKEKKESEDKEEFLKRLKHGQPKQRRNTRPPFRLTGSAGPK